MNLETLSHIFGITGAAIGLFSVFMIYRKRLLNIGWDAFSNQYRTEMDDFKEFIRSDINMFREMANKNDERHTRTLERIVELYGKTHKAVSDQTNICEVLRTGHKSEKKMEDNWKNNIKSELDEVKKDVSHIKKVLNHGKNISG